ncbi:MAG: hypothetical protein WAT23_13890 [Chromatiaceae bacterium]
MALTGNWAGVGGKVIYVSPFDPGRKVILNSGVIYKVLDKKITVCSRQRMNTLQDEYEILSSLQKYDFVPRRPRYFSDDLFDVLAYDYVDGKPLKLVDLRLFSILTLKLIVLFLKLSWAGVIHRDIKLDNLIFKPSGNLCLIDFDQARRARRVDALLANVLCPSAMRPAVHGSLFQMLGLCAEDARIMNRVKRAFKVFLPTPILQLRRVIRRKLVRESSQKISIIPSLHEGASKKLKLLSQAWAIAQGSDASSPGVSICYYSLFEEGYTFPGERPWGERWHYLRHALDFRGKRVLELGCNVALLSTFLLKEGGVSSALAVDSDYEVLCAAQLVAGAFGVAPLFTRADFDSHENWEYELENFNPDIVFCLNVKNWVQNKVRLEKFLLGFPIIVYEGHDNDEKEKRLFVENGFDVEDIACSERGRTVFKAVRAS